MIYSVKFEIYGKRMKTEVEATSKIEARQKIINKIIFHEIELKYVANDSEVMDYFNKNIFK